MSKEENSKKQYPGYLKGKKVRVEKSTGSIATGLLRDIHEYRGEVFLVMEIDSFADQIINLSHVVSIEEGAN